MKKKLKCQRYEIVRGTDGDLMEIYEGNWEGCERRLKELGGCYARRSDRGFPAIGKVAVNKDEFLLASQSKQIRRRRAFLALPDALQVEDVLWELRQIGLPCVAEMVKEKLT